MECGTNLQNWSKHMRIVCEPDPGKSFVQVDQSGAEALIVAYLCRAAKYRDLFIHGVKPHVFVGLHLFADQWKTKRPDLVSVIDFALQSEIKNLKLLPGWKELDGLIKDSDNWTAAERYYYLAKQTCHSSNYDVKAPTFILNILAKSDGVIVLNLQQGKYFLQKYRELFPEIVEWRYRVAIEAKQTGFLRNLFGFPREFTQHIDTDNYESAKELYAFVPQSTVACITRKAFTDFQNYIENNNLDWDLLADTHDSYMCQCPDSEVKPCAQKMQEFMGIELTSPFDGVKFRMKSEAQCGKNWGGWNEKKNPFGLKTLDL